MSFFPRLWHRTKHGLKIAFLAVISLGIVLTLLGFLGWISLTTQGKAWRTTWIPAQITSKNISAEHTLNSLLHRAGLKPYQISLHGLRRQTESSVLALIPPLNQRDTLLSVNIDDLLARILKLPWVASAAIERVWPNQLRISVTEREPLALWQNNKQLKVIDLEGRVIPLPSLKAYKSLPLVIGPHAPDHAQAFLEALSQTNVVKRTMASASYVYNRRWNITLANGAIIMLPQNGWKEALAALEKMEAETQLISRVAKEHIKSIDLRTPPQVIIRLQEASAKSYHNKPKA